MSVRPTNELGIAAGLTPSQAAGDSQTPLAKFLHTARVATLPSLFALAACGTTGAYPPAADIAAVTEAKPRPPAEILTDPAANDRYNSAIEGWGDRLYAAGGRLCRFAERTGMAGISCPKGEAPD